MPLVAHHKLVRDHIPEIITSNGGTFEARTVTGVEYRRALLAKLVEEAQELLESDGSLEERADVAEVLRALDKTLQFSDESIEQVRKDKHAKRGGFDLGVFLESVTAND